MRLPLAGVSLSLLLLVALPVYAAEEWSLPESDRLLAQTRPEPILPPEELDIEPAEEAPLEPDNDDEISIEEDRQLRICEDTTSPDPPIQAIRIENLDALHVLQDDLQREVERLISVCQGLPASETNRQTIQDAITQIYLNNGYLSTRAAILDNENNDPSLVSVSVLEGTLDAILIENEELRIQRRYIESRIRLAVPDGYPLQAQDLEDQLRLLNNDPLFENVEASLRASDGENQTENRDEGIRASDLHVRVIEAPPLEFSFGIDNYSPASVGSERFNASLLYRNPTGLGDAISIAFSNTLLDGAESWDFGYQVPLNPMNGTLSIGATFETTEIIQDPFSELDIQGESERYAIQFIQPVIRTPVEELAFSLGFDFKDGQTFLFNDIPTPFGFGPDEEGISRTSVIRFGQNYLHRDPRGAVAVRSRFNVGLDWFDATRNEGDIPDSRFFSWFGQVQRVQRLSDDHLVVLQADLQLTPDSLLPSEQFVIGGGQSIRAFRQNARSGDNGFRFLIEDRITLTRDEAGIPILQVAPFLDMGSVWNHPDNPNQLPRQNFLISTGLAIFFDPLPWLNIQASYGIPLVDLSDRGNNIQDEGFYFGVTVQQQL